MDSPRPPSLSRASSALYEVRPGSHPLQSAQSSISSFTAYFGASTLVSEDERKDSLKSSQHGAEDKILIPLITQAFAPCVPIVASPDTNDLAKRKGFASFFDMLRPFGDMIGNKVVYKDTTGFVSPLEKFNVNFVELGPASNLIHYGQVDVQRPGLVPPADLYAPGGDLVALERQIENEMQLAGENLTQTGKSEIDDSTANSSIYYHSFLKSLLSGLPASSHETFTHPVAMCIAVSSQNQFPIATLASLYESSKKNLPVWIDPEFLRYYVLVHDEDQDDPVRSTILYDEMRLKYGTHCYLLRINSTKVDSGGPNLEVPSFDRRSAPERLRSRWLGSGRTNSFLPNAVLQAESTETQIRYLSTTDHSNIVSLVREMVIRSIVPFMQRSITTWNEEVAGPRRGLAGRFFKVGRSLWGSSSRAVTPVGNGNYDAHTSSYGPDTPEAQLRKLADYAFMLRDWKLANGVYDMLRKDFSNDKAWKHHAGAQEMFVVSQLLQSPTITEKMRTEVITPTLDSALYNYLSRSTAPFSALRTMLLTAELLRHKGGGLVDDAAKLIMRIMAENLVGEMTRALLVDRVGFCFASGQMQSIKCPAGVHPAAVNYAGSRRRKAAFWRALAAESWSSIGKHRLARQALREALKVYEDTEWIAIQGTLSTLKFDTGLSETYDLTPSPRRENAPTISQDSEPAHNNVQAEDSAPTVAAIQTPETVVQNELSDETALEKDNDNSTAQEHISIEDVPHTIKDTPIASVKVIADASPLVSQKSPIQSDDVPPSDIQVGDSIDPDEANDLPYTARQEDDIGRENESHTAIVKDDPEEDAIDALPSATVCKRLSTEIESDATVTSKSPKPAVDMSSSL